MNDIHHFNSAFGKGLLKPDLHPVAEIDWTKVKTAFEAARTLEEGPKRLFLDDLYRSDHAAAAEVSALLALDTRTADRTLSLDDAAPALLHDLARALEGSSARELIGTTIGPWNVVAPIASGGMGAVYLAERRDSGFVKRGALKVIHFSSSLNNAAITRFNSERKILATLEHPNIAHLLDGGTLADGRPFLVMEYIKGTALTDYCRDGQLPARQRTVLFLKVCRAVSAAHRALVLHRDIKPANILVNAEGEPKLLDFGIAKDMSFSADDPTMTLAQQRMMTIRYASPEQITGASMSTQTDVYSLGVVLYELMCGRNPFNFPTSDPLAMAHVVLTQEPTPLRFISRRSTEDAEWAPALSRELLTDLDAIVEKAIRKPPSDRYRSVDALIEDVERAISGLPVQARNGTFAYKTRKFLKRNTISVGAGAIVGMLLILTALTWRHQRDIIATEKRRAEQVSAFLEGLFEQADPLNNKGKPLTVSDVLDIGVRKLMVDRATPPALQGEFAITLANVESHLGRNDVASDLLESVLQRIPRGTQADSVISRMLLKQAYLLAEMNKPKEVLEKLDDASKFGVSRDERDYVRAKGAYVQAVMGRLNDRLPEAIRLIDESIALLSGQNAASANWSEVELPPDKIEDVRVALLERCHIEVQRGSTNALSACSAAREMVKKAFGVDDPRLIPVWNLEAMYLDDQGDIDRAIEIYRRILDLQITIFGRDHINVAKTYVNLGVSYKSKGMFPESELAYEEAIRLLTKNPGRGHPATLVAMNNLANVRYAQGRYEQSLQDHISVAEARKVVLTPGHRDLAQSFHNIAKCLYRLGRKEEASIYVKQAFEVYAKGGAEPSATAKTRILDLLLKVDQEPTGVERFAQDLLAEIRASGSSDNLAAIEFARAKALWTLNAKKDALVAGRSALNLFAKDLSRDLATPAEVQQWLMSRDDARLRE